MISSTAWTGPRLSGQRLQCVRSPKAASLRREQQRSFILHTGPRGRGWVAVASSSRPVLALPWPCSVLPFPSFIFNRAAAHLRHTDRTQNHPHWLLPVPFSQVDPWTCLPPSSCNCCNCWPGLYLSVYLPAYLVWSSFVRTSPASRKPTKQDSNPTFCRHRQLPLT